MALPFGNSITVKPKKGHADSAPTKPRIGIKIIVTSVIAVILTIILVHLIENHYLSRFIDVYFVNI